MQRNKAQKTMMNFISQELELHWKYEYCNLFETYYNLFPVIALQLLTISNNSETRNSSHFH